MTREASSSTPDADAAVAALVDAAVVRALALHGHAGEEVGVRLTDDAELRDLNRRFRGIDASTDVLSFPLGEAVPGEPFYLGDVAISLERARAQAQDYGHSLEREVCYLAVHGVLHLLGYDDATEEELAAMHRATEAVLAELGLAR